MAPLCGIPLYTWHAIPALMTISPNPHIQEACEQTVENDKKPCDLA